MADQKLSENKGEKPAYPYGAPMFSLPERTYTSKTGGVLLASINIPCPLLRKSLKATVWDQPKETAEGTEHRITVSLPFGGRSALANTRDDDPIVKAWDARLYDDCIDGYDAWSTEISKSNGGVSVEPPKRRELVRLVKRNGDSKPLEAVAAK